NSSSSGSIRRCCSTSLAILGGSRPSILTYHLLPERVLPSSVKTGEVNRGRLVEKPSARAFIFCVNSVRQNDIPGFEPDLTEEGLAVASELYEPILPVSSQKVLEALRAQQPVILYTKLKSAV